MPCRMKRIFLHEPGCRAGKLFVSQILVGSEAGMRCQEKTRAAEQVAQVTKVGDHPYDGNVGFVGNDLLIEFYLIKLDRSSRHVCA